MQKLTPIGISVTEFAERWKNIISTLPIKTSFPKVGIALSGGVDSMTLLKLMTQVIPTNDLFAITVDHKLRPESSLEAAGVAEVVKSFNVAHRIVELEWDQHLIEGKESLQEEAREMRSKVLYKTCQELGVSFLLFAHNLEDDITTSLYRIGKGTRVEGLAGMKRVSYMNVDLEEALGKVIALRPLLTFPKADIIATAEHFKIPFFKDPSNDSYTYTRNLANRAWELACQIDPYFTRERSVALMTRLKYYKSKVLKTARQFLSEYFLFDPVKGDAIVSVRDNAFQRDEYSGSRAVSICGQMIKCDHVGVKFSVCHTFISDMIRSYEKLVRNENIMYRDYAPLRSQGRLALSSLPGRLYPSNLKDWQSCKGNNRAKYGILLNLCLAKEKKTRCDGQTIERLVLEPGQSFTYMKRYQISYEYEGKLEKPLEFKVEPLSMRHLRLFMEVYPDHSKKQVFIDLFTRITSARLYSFPVVSCASLNYIVFPVFGVDGPENKGFKWNCEFLGTRVYRQKFDFVDIE